MKKLDSAVEGRNEGRMRHPREIFHGASEVA